MAPHARIAGMDRRQVLACLGATAVAASAPVSAEPAEAAIAAMIQRGQAREAALREVFPFGKPDGSSPYVVSRRHGAWLDLAAPDAVRRLDAETDRLRAEAAKGIVPPLFLLEEVIAGQRAVDGPDALRRQREALEALRPRAGSAAGVSALPGGRAYYVARLRCATGTDGTPEALDARVGTAIRRLLARVDGLLAGLGLGRGSVGSRLRALKARPEHLYTGGDAGRAAAVADMNAALDRLRPRLPIAFNPPIPPGEVRRMSAGDENAHRRGYREPPFYHPDLATVHERPRFTLVTVAYHETLPGHLLQLRRQADAAPSAAQVRYAPGYAEGWAIYAESLADSMGLLSPVEQIGFVQSLLFRLARVAADIGLHWHGWDRARARRFLEETVGFELFFPFAQEVDRYAVEPAGFAGDAAVALTLIALARRRGGGLRAFHDRVLNRGPLSVEALSAIA
jgi:uncharacterized protein (DUF885 family)